MDVVLYVFIFLLFLGLCGIIWFLLQQIDRLENKLMARDFTEYAVRSNNKSPGTRSNFMADSIKRAYKEKRDRLEDFDDDEN